jgi:hypothetical protein
MNIFGYSERGMINSLFYEMKNSSESNKVLKEFIAQISFPFREEILIKRNIEIISATILIEQSFSDFGDADVVILFEHDNIKYSVFIEAKVKSTRTKGRSIDSIFDEFENGMQNKKLKSNLFNQIYNKMRMVEAFNSTGLDALKSGVNFPDFSKKRRKVIGRNKVVLKAIEQLKEYCANALYVILVPDTQSNMEMFFKTKLKEFEIDQKRIWDTDRLGFITWEQVENYCMMMNFRTTIKNFEFNSGQIYK